MLFNSIEFLVFFPIVVTFYFMTPFRFRWILLLLSSYYFYMCWKPEYVILIVLSTVVDYYAAIMMGRTTEKRRRKKYLALSIVSNLGLLFLFKYFNFFGDSVRALLSQFSVVQSVPHLNMLLPIGISFYTFQTLSYSIDVYRGVKKPEKHFGYFALYVSFFPQLVAGPIERSTRLMPQFFKKHKFDTDRVISGLRIMAWGFFKKVVIADNISLVVDQIYNHSSNYSGLVLIFGTVCFAFQIYCDFSGYSDIAIGGARVMGFNLMKNFDRPYSAKSVAEFWQRWHISLSTWFRDYLYIPLGGNRVTVPRWYFNVIVTFVISGLWHGASWNFIIWGALHGGYFSFSALTKKFRERFVRISGLSRYPRLHDALRVLTTFCLVNFAWIFFRANTLSDAIYIVKNIFVNLLSVNQFGELMVFFSKMKLSYGSFIAVIGAILIMEWIQRWQAQGGLTQTLFKKPFWVRYPIYTVLAVFVLMFGKLSAQNFIYFQF